MNGKKQIIFKNGCFDGLKFTEISNNEYSAPDLLVPGLKRLGFKNPDLELFFARSEKGYGSADLFWEINDHDSHKTLEFYQLDDLLNVKAEIEFRDIQFEKDLRHFYGALNPITTEDKKIFEALNGILVNFSERKLYTGFDSRKKNHFPVVIGWGGKFLPVSNNSGELIGVSSKKNNTSGPTTNFQEIKNSTVPTTRSANQFYWLIWLIIFLLALFITAKLLPSCGLRGVANACEPSGSSLNEIDELEVYIQKLTRQTLVQHNICMQVDKVEVPDLRPVPTEGDLEIKSRLDREEVTSSELSVSLAWDTKEDLDISVVCPNSNSVSFQKKLIMQNDCGNLDIDANYSPPISMEPIEYIDLKPLTGIYKIKITSRENEHSNKNQIPTKFKVEINDSGTIKLFDGSIYPGNTKDFSFDRQP